MVEYISENSMVNTCMKGLFNVIDQVDCSSKEFDGSNIAAKYSDFIRALDNIQDANQKYEVNFHYGE